MGGQPERGGGKSGTCASMERTESLVSGNGYSCCTYEKNQQGTNDTIGALAPCFPLSLSLIAVVKRTTTKRWRR